MHTIIYTVLSLNLIAFDVCADDFIIDNEKCRLPNLPAFSEEVRPLFYSLEYFNCSEKELLTFVIVENNVAYLDIRKDIFGQYSQHPKITCCYSYVKRNGSERRPDIGVSYSPCIDFHSKTALLHDTVYVECKHHNRIIYENVHSSIIITEKVAKKLKNSLEPGGVKPLSVLILAIDGLSRLNFERTMPETKKMLLSNDFAEFVAYNKIEDMTLPNFNALLTGLDFDHTRLYCDNVTRGILTESCPMIWYDFKKAGYVTAYGEDWVEINTFQHRGFRKPPTDYYFKPYMEAASKLESTKVDTMPYCAGPEPQGERIMKLATDFSVTFLNQPTFAIFWMNTFSHNYINSPTRMDGKMRKFFEGLKENGIFNDSMIILISDHGIREGEIRQTVQGYYEERLPINYISVPDWFKDRHPHKFVHFRENSRKLTSTYDMYMTLQDVLSMSTNNYEIHTAQGCQTCKSIFSKIPRTRSCLDAGIFPSWCTCMGNLSKTHPDLTVDVETEAIDFYFRNVPEKIQAHKKDIRIISTSLTYFREVSYFLMTFSVYSQVNLFMLEGTMKPIKFQRIITNLKIKDS